MTICKHSTSRRLCRWLLVWTWSYKIIFVASSFLSCPAHDRINPRLSVSQLSVLPNDDDHDKHEMKDMEDDSMDNSELLDFSIDSFLRGDYDRQFADDAPAPHPGLTPRTTIEAALRSLRQLDFPEPSHGAAVLLRFCVPLSRGERWGDSSSSRRSSKSAWKEVLRGAITPTMLARRLRASEFSCLLDWANLDVTEGAYSVQRDDGIVIGVPSTVAFVNAALYFGDGVEPIEPILVQFTLRKINGVWLIDSARLSQKGLFVDSSDGELENGRGKE